jgi:hypothetical protein
MAEDPRFSFKPRKDGQPSYYQPASKDMQGFDKHGYIITVPTLQFNVLGKPMRSASEFRANFAQADSETQRAMITDLFGQYDPKTHNTMAQKIVEQLIRADEILDKLIEMGADDCYILEACIRVESLVESINMKQRKQTLYQAIMEGGHSLPEQDLGQTFKKGAASANSLAHSAVAMHSKMDAAMANSPFAKTQQYKDYQKTNMANKKAAMQKGMPYGRQDGPKGPTTVSVPENQVGTFEEITDFNTEDPMNSVIAIRGIGTMSISSALEKVSEMAMDIAKLGAMKDAKNVQDNLPRYMDLLATYNESIQEAYRELAQQRKRGGTASRGIDKDISEDDITDRNKKALQKALMVKNIQALQKQMPMKTEALSDEEMDAFHVELDKLVHKYFGHSSDEKKMDEGKKTWMKDGVEMCSKDCCGAPVTECTCGPDCKHCDCYKINEAKSDNLNTDNVDPRFKNLIKTAIIKYPFAKNAMDAVLHMMSDKLKTDAAQSADIKRLDKENDAQDTEIDDLEKQIAKEHCGDPMAHEHKPGRMLLMKLYKKEMQCQPGSPEHFEVMKMIDGCRKNIGLEEGMWDDAKKAVSGAAKAVTNKVASDYDRRNKLFNKGKPA